MEHRATTAQVSRAIANLCQRGLDSVALRQAVIGELRRVILFDACCMGTIDPGTLLITSEVSEGLPDRAFSLAAENEYLVEDVYKFSQLARSAQRYGILSQGMHGDLQHSHRYRSVMPIIGATHELRAAFVSHQACWGGVTLFRFARFFAYRGAVSGAAIGAAGRGLSPGGATGSLTRCGRSARARLDCARCRWGGAGDQWRRACMAR